MPHITNNRTYLEIFNELMILLQTYHMAVFSKFNMNDNSKLLLGQTYISILGITMAVNMMNMMNKSVKNIRYKRRLKAIITAKLFKQKMLKVL